MQSSLLLHEFLLQSNFLNSYNHHQSSLHTNSIRYFRQYYYSMHKQLYTFPNKPLLHLTYLFRMIDLSSSQLNYFFLMQTWQPSFRRGRSWQPSFRRGRSWQPSFRRGRSWQPSFRRGRSWQPSFRRGRQERPNCL